MATEPTILDAQGHPLAKGMQVEAEHMDRGEVVLVGEEPGYYGHWPLQIRHAKGVTPYSALPTTEANTYRCPDLKAVLTPDPEEKR